VGYKAIHALKKWNEMEARLSIANIFSSCSQFSSHQQSFSSSTLEVTVRGTESRRKAGFFFIYFHPMVIHQGRTARPNVRSARAGINQCLITEIVLTYLSVLLIIRHLNIVCYE
jgi:hypothetical protein